MSSGSGGSHGLCGSGRPVAVCAAPIAETRVARSVGIVASSSMSGGFISGRESSSRVSVAARTAACGIAPRGRPPTREDWNWRRLACPSRA